MLLVRSYKKWIWRGGGGAKLRVSNPRYLFIALSSLVKYPSIQRVRKKIPKYIGFSYVHRVECCVPLTHGNTSTVLANRVWDKIDGNKLK